MAFEEGICQRSVKPAKLLVVEHNWRTDWKLEEPQVSPHETFAELWVCVGGWGARSKASKGRRSPDTVSWGLSNKDQVGEGACLKNTKSLS